MTERDLYLYERRGAEYLPSALCFGPWSARTQNGAMVAALVAQALDSVPTRMPMIPMDFHLTILKPVPFGPLTVNVRVVREGQKLQVLQGSLLAGSTEVALATLVKLRDAPEIAPAQNIAAHAERLPDTLERSPASHAYFETVDCRVLRGGFNALRPGAVWMRMCARIVAGSDNAALGALALYADAGSGLGTLVPRTEWSYPNVTLALRCHRNMVGEWVLIDSTMHTQGHGVAQIQSTLSDLSSCFGQAHQSVILEPTPAQGA